MKLLLLLFIVTVALFLADRLARFLVWLKYQPKLQWKHHPDAAKVDLKVEVYSHTEKLAPVLFADRKEVWNVYEEKNMDLSTLAKPRSKQ